MIYNSCSTKGRNRRGEMRAIISPLVSHQYNIWLPSLAKSCSFPCVQHLVHEPQYREIHREHRVCDYDLQVSVLVLQRQSMSDAVICLDILHTIELTAWPHAMGGAPSPPSLRNGFLGVVLAVFKCYVLWHGEGVKNRDNWHYIMYAQPLTCTSGSWKQEDSLDSTKSSFPINKMKIG